MIRQKKKLILIAGAAALVLAVLVIVLFATVWRETPETAAEEDFLVAPLDMEDIAEITVKSRENGYRLYRGEDGQVYFEGAEYVLYNQNMIAYLRSCTAYLAVSGRVEHPAQMEEYSLTEDTCLASFSVTSLAGESYRVLIGEKLVSGEGYYARLADSEEVAVLGSALERCLFSDVRFFLSGQVAGAISENDYFDITRFSIERDGKEYVTVEKIPEDEVRQTDLSTHRVSFPARYEPNTDLLVRIFKSFISFVGNDVEEFSLADRSAEEFSALMRKYGFLSSDGAAMRCRVTYTYHDAESEVYVSAPEEESGKTYVYSPGFDIIASFDSDSLAWTDYDLMEYTQKELFAHSIADVKSVSVKSEHVTETFSLFHGAEAKDLAVSTSRGQAVDAQAFRRFYSQILYIENAGYADVPEDYRDRQSLVITVTLSDGAENEFVFYDIATRQSFYEIGGEGVYYVNRDYVKKVIGDAVKLINGEEVEAVRYA